MANKTVPMGQAYKRDIKPVSEEASISTNAHFSGVNDKYEIFADRMIGKGGEAEVYIAKRESDGEELLAKIYTMLDLRDIGNRKETIKFLSGQNDYRRTHLLPLFDAGEVDVELKDGGSASCKVDIIPYCKEGNVGKCSYQKLREDVIPGVLAALHVMHEANLIHRDIKPDNLYLYNGVVVIGDFGTVGRISADEHAASFTRLGRGTIGYAAPEVRDGYAVVPSDYYGFGCTIATLYKGSHVYSELVETHEESKFHHAVNVSGLPLACPKSEEDLQVLVDALTLFNYTDRAGYEDVQQWLDDPASFVKAWKGRRSKAEDEPFEYRFINEVYHNSTDLAKAFAAHWDMGKRELYSGGLNNSQFLNFLIRMKHPCTDQVRTILEEREKDFSRKFDDDLGFAKTLHYYCTGGVEGAKCPLFWLGKEYENLSDIALAMDEKGADRKGFEHLLKSKFISWKIEQQSNADYATSLAKVGKIENNAEKFTNLAYYLFVYTFAPKGHFRPFSPDEVFYEITSTSTGFYESIRSLLADERSLAELASNGYESQVFDLKKNLKSDFLDNVTLIYMLFESICSDKEGVREHYINYGPLAYSYWLKQHLDLYNFTSKAAQENAERIQEVELSTKDSIVSLSKQLTSLKSYYMNVLERFQNDMFSTLLSLDTNKDITSTSVDAYFKVDFFGVSIPVGFARQIGYVPKKPSTPSKQFIESRAGSEYRMTRNPRAGRTTTPADSIKVRVAAGGTKFVVRIIDVKGNKREVARSVAYCANVSMERAEKMLQQFPVVVRDSLTLDEANDVKNDLAESGAVVEVLRQGSNGSYYQEFV